MSMVAYAVGGHRFIHFRIQVAEFRCAPSSADAALGIDDDTSLSMMASLSKGANGKMALVG